jgi:hypothetical protein
MCFILACISSSLHLGLKYVRLFLRMCGTIPVRKCVHIHLSACLCVTVHHCTWTTVEQKCDQLWQIMKTDIIVLCILLMNDLAVTGTNKLYCLKL